jgi:hypothetical protein
MNHNEQLMTAISQCRTAARTHGHTLGVWHPLDDERLHVALCGVCGAMVWATRSRGERRWRIGGSMLKQDCPEDDLGSASEV